MSDFLERVKKLEKCEIHVGDRVTSKRIGQIFTGTVISITPSFLLAGPAPITLKLWDEYYPGWQDSYICVVAYDQETKPYSFEEFKELTEASGYSPDALKEIYDKTPLMGNNFYPAEDLEIL